MTTLIILVLWAGAVAFANADMPLTALGLAAASVAASYYQWRRVRPLMED